MKLNLFNKVIVAVFASSLIFSSCHELKPLGDILIPPVGGEAPLTQAEVVKGLKEALVRGAGAAADKASREDGFYRNPMLFIPFPEEAIKVKETAERFGFKGQVDQFEMTLNRAAEEASKEAREVFVTAITGMSVQDGFNILNGPNNAATVYLRQTAGQELENRFRPKVRTAIESVQLTSYWEPLVSTYNTFAPLAGGGQVNPDLESYVTARAINGLFVHIEAEEQLIRQDPAARVTELLRRVFGSVSN